MKIFYHPKQALHDPKIYFTRGKIREPQEVPARLVEFLKGIKLVGKEVEKPVDLGIDPITRIHGFAYIDFLQSTYKSGINFLEIGGGRRIIYGD